MRSVGSKKKSDDLLQTYPHLSRLSPPGTGEREPGRHAESCRKREQEPRESRRAGYKGAVNAAFHEATVRGQRHKMELPGGIGTRGGRAGMEAAGARPARASPPLGPAAGEGARWPVLPAPHTRPS